MEKVFLSPSLSLLEIPPCVMHFLEPFGLRKIPQSPMKFQSLLLGSMDIFGNCPSIKRAIIMHKFIYRLTHVASELSGFTCTSSLTMNEKFLYRMRPPSAVLKIFIIQTEYTANKNHQTFSQRKPWCNDSGVLHHGYYTTIMMSRRLFCHNPVSHGTNQPIRKLEFV